jgi:hypothetical protein
LVKGGTSEVVYAFRVPDGFVGFIGWIGVSPSPEGATATWIVDGEKVDWQREFGGEPVGSLDKPTCVNPPIVVQRETFVEVYSPVDWEYTIFLDGELYELPISREELARVKTKLSPEDIDKIVGEVKTSAEKTVETVKTTIGELKPKLEPERETVFRDKWKNVDISKKYILIEEEGHGSLHELLIKSTTTNFNVHLEADGKILYDGSYGDISSEPQFLSEQSAFEDPDNAGTYYLQVKDITFSKKIFAYVWGTGTLAEIYIKYSLKV